ncbi:Tcp11-domain-containing protein [Saitoella complicata NRRL Y-17804]|uniref:Tcp11-domain-containing protein n=1 Tax=Saitoella complicata (strain BCRC 22490 / CBS 7301 / JCM 7358 / NBRC 10748 / NRRL Y-17804) TaxID=698492 RepID=UPI0008675235|nr:Tcp11-domain-containing protein [Saitoella complicata NRRL Y-17804]ODQ52872.1 Tcp11-domain-containing protein [Saitoella complicata NRRL Y-17804]
MDLDNIQEPASSPIRDMSDSSNFFFDLSPAKTISPRPARLQPRHRRHSISSATSHKSGGSARHVTRMSSCDEDITAVRRAAFIEGRKNRLAARAVEREEVLARARTGIEGASSKLAELQKSIAAANVAREKMLATVTSACGDQVAKAKAKAAEMREKRLEEVRMMKLALEERLANAAKRREEMRKTKRTSRPSVGSVEEKSPERKVLRREVSEVERRDAARVIQRTWRRSEKRRAAQAFFGLGVDVSAVHELPFEELVYRFQDQKVLKATIRALKATGLVGDEEPPMKQMEACRIFLSSYMILGHPEEILSGQGEREQELVRTTNILLRAFENSVRSPASSVDLLAAWPSYLVAFRSWKAHDSAILVEGMAAQYAELSQIWETVKDSEASVADEYKRSIRNNQLMLLQKIRKLAGEDTRKVVGKAIAEAKKRRKELKKAVEALPKPSPSRTRPESAGSARNSGSARQEFTVPATSIVANYGVNLSNRQLMHELLLDPNFKLEPPEKSPLEKAVETQVKRAFFDSVREGLRNGEEEDWIPGLAKDVRSRLLRLVVPDSPTAQMISGALDLTVIEQQCRTRTFDYQRFCEQVVHMMRRLCAPFRDEMVQGCLVPAAAEDRVEGFVECAKAILEVLDVLLLDHANFHLTIAAPMLLPEAVAYERKRFDEDVKAGRASLESTKKWLQAHAQEATQTAESRDPEGVQHPKSKPTLSPVFAAAMVDVVVPDSTGTLPDLPETFHLDVDRIVEYRQTAHKITVVATLILHSKNLARAGSPQQDWSQLKERLWVILKDGQTTAEHLTSEVQHYIGSASTSSSAADNLVSRVLDGSDTVFKLLRRRLRAYMEAWLTAGLARGDEPGSRSRPSQQLAAAASGMEELAGELKRLGEKVRKLGEVNRDCYGGLYDGILRGREAPGG